jgi:hypothetical protein
MTESKLPPAPGYDTPYAAAIILPCVPANVAGSQLIEAMAALGVPQDGWTMHIASTAEELHLYTPREFFEKSGLEKYLTDLGVIGPAQSCWADHADETEKERVANEAIGLLEIIAEGRPENHKSHMEMTQIWLEKLGKETKND